MGFFQFIKNELNRVNDRLDGRCVSYIDLCCGFVSDVRRKSERLSTELPANCKVKDWEKMQYERKLRYDFFAAQAVYKCIADALIERPTNFERYRTLPESGSRWFKAFDAMRMELDNGRMYCVSQLGRCLYQQCPTLGDYAIKDFIGFEILPEYERITREVESQSTGHKFEKELYSRHRECERQLLAKCYCTRFNINDANEFHVYDIGGCHVDFLRESERIFRDCMDRVRLTDISDSYI